MNIHTLSRTLGGLLAIGIGMTGAAQAASAPRAERGVAIVAGVNRYPNLTDANLSGAVPDAQSIARRFESLGYRVILLVDGDATKQNLLRQIRQAGSADRFVFYFSGHGAPGRGSQPYILPSDTQEGQPQSGLNVDELYQAVGQVPAAARTVMLDSCFSGRMIRDRNFAAMSAGRTVTARPRAYDFLHVGSIHSPLSYSPAVPSAAPRAGSGICYVTASDRDEVSWESDGRGLFTRSVERRLTGDGTLWSSILSSVRTEVREGLLRIPEWIRKDSTQTPQVSVDFLQSAHLSGSGVIGSPPPDLTGPGLGGNSGATLSSLGDVYHLDNPNPERLMLNSSSPSSLLEVGERIRFTVRAQQSGYLVVLNQTPDGQVSVLFPARQADEGRVQRSRVVTIPQTPGGWLVANEEGQDNVKVLLFNRREDAQRVLDLFDSRSIHGSRLGQSRFQPGGTITTGNVITAELRFRVEGR